MDGCMDGEDLIICVARLVVQKLWRPLTCDDFRAGSIASRNKLSSSTHLFASQAGFGAILGGFGRSKWE